MRMGPWRHQASRAVVLCIILNMPCMTLALGMLATVQIVTDGRRLPHRRGQIIIEQRQSRVQSRATLPMGSEWDLRLLPNDCLLSGPHEGWHWCQPCHSRRRLPQWISICQDQVMMAGMHEFAWRRTYSTSCKWMHRSPGAGQEWLTCPAPTLHTVERMHSKDK